VIDAAKEYEVSSIMLAGWVSANTKLTELVQEKCLKHNIKLLTPIEKRYCMDNAAMIGILTYYRVKYKMFEHHIGTVKI
jgi:N6-L-threonylcarbamoyladenine synthase